MIIEFTGVPCSGKSAVSHQLAQLLRQEKYSVCERQYEASHNKGKAKRTAAKLLSVLKYCLSHPRFSVSCYKMIGSKRLWLNYINLKAHCCSEDFCILEQGYLQFIGSVFDNSDVEREKLLTLASALLPKEKHIQVIINISDETVLRRAQAREDKPYFMNAENIEDAVKKASALSRELKEVWESIYGNALLIEISNEEENGCQKAANTVLTTLRQMKMI